MEPTPTAAPAAPVAAPVAPAPAAPAAVAAAPAPAPAAPAAPAPAPAPAAATGDSLLDGAAPAPAAPAAEPTDDAVLAAARDIVAKADEAARLAAQPNSGLAWNLNDTTPGAGEKPAWFKSDKYVSVAKQAEAYVALEKQLGAFTGAPKDGNYEVKGLDLGPQGMAAPHLVAFKDWAAKNNVSNDKFNELLGQMAQYEASQKVPMNTVLKQLGPDATSRIGNVVTWAKANLDEAGFQLMRTATAHGKTAAATFAMLERVISKTSQVRMPKPGEDTASAAPGGLAAIAALQAKKGADGKRLFESDPKYRADVERQLTEYYTANPVVRDQMGNIRG